MNYKKYLALKFASLDVVDQQWIRERIEPKRLDVLNVYIKEVAQLGEKIDQEVIRDLEEKFSLESNSRSVEASQSKEWSQYLDILSQISGSEEKRLASLKACVAQRIRSGNER